MIRQGTMTFEEYYKAEFDVDEIKETENTEEHESADEILAKLPRGWRIAAKVIDKACDFAGWCLTNPAIWAFVIPTIACVSSSMKSGK